MLQTSLQLREYIDLCKPQSWSQGFQLCDYTAMKLILVLFELHLKPLKEDVPLTLFAMDLHASCEVNILSLWLTINNRDCGYTLLIVSLKTGIILLRSGTIFSLQLDVWELGLYSGITAVNFLMSQLVKGWDNRKNTNNTVLLGKLWEYDGEALTAGSQTQIHLCLLAPTKGQCFKTGAELLRCVCTMLPSTSSATSGFLLIFKGCVKNSFALISFLGFHKRKALRVLFPCQLCKKHCCRLGDLKHYRLNSLEIRSEL